MYELIVNCFKSKGNNIESVRDEGSINETDFFTLTIESYIKLPKENLVILITDYPFELDERTSNGKFIYTLNENSLRRYFREIGFDFKDYSKEINFLKFSRLFINYPVGISEIQLFNKKTNTIIYEFLINIVSDKLNEGEFISLVNYIESKSLALWARYSLMKNAANPNEEIDKNDWQFLFFQIFIKELDSKLYDFQYDKFKSFKKQAELVSYSADVLVDEESICWLIQNSDYLVNTHSSDYEKILIQNRLFRPSEILTNLTYESTDIIENHFVHGFIDELIQFLNSKKVELHNFNYLGENKEFQEMLYFYSQKRKLRLVDEYLNYLINLKSNLLEFIPVTKTVLEYIPTNRLYSKDHYKFIYEKFVEWFNFDRIKFSNNKVYFKGVTRMDKLFERACLYKIIDLFNAIGYKVEIKQKRNDIPRIIFFESENGRSHTLFFETFPDNIFTQTGNGNLEPDFFIHFSNNKYLIMDAKYKNNSNVRNYDWEKLGLKYLHGLGYKHGEYFSPIALFALLPASNNKTEFYQNAKYDLNSTTPAFPAIGSIIVDFEGESRDLDIYMNKCLQLVYM